jgi:hypothetical protein
LFAAYHVFCVGVSIEELWCSLWGFVSEDAVAFEDAEDLVVCLGQRFSDLSFSGGVLFFLGRFCLWGPFLGGYILLIGWLVRFLRSLLAKTAGEAPVDVVVV